MLLLMVVSLYTSRVLLSALGVVDFGLYNVVGGVVMMLGFLQGTMSTASSRFITVALSHKDIDRMRKVFSNIFLINLFLSLVVVVLAETIGLWFLLEKMTIPDERVHASLWVYQFSVVSVALNIITVPFNASIIAHERMGAFAYISLFDAFAKLLIVYLITVSPFDRLIFYAFLIFFVHSVDIAIYNIYCIRKFPETRTKFIYDKTIVKDIFSFVVWASYGSFVSVGFTQGLNIILNMFFGPAVNAARGIAVQVQHAVVQFTNNFQTAINPQLMKKTAQQEFEDARNLLIASSKYSFFILCLIGIPIITNTPYILSLWLKNVPEYSVSFCRIMLCICIWSSLANSLRIVNQAEGNIKKFQICECSLLLLIMPISYITLKFWQIPILVFVVHLVIELLSQIVRVWIVLPKIRMSYGIYFIEVMAKVIPVFFLPLILGMLIINTFEDHNIFLTFLATSLIEEIVLFLSIYFIGMKETEKFYLCQIVRKYLSSTKRRV